jgi:UDP-glucose 4-epimerase
LLPHQDNPRFRLYEGDIRDAAFVRSAMQSAKPDIVVHLAAIHFIPLCEANPAQTISVNVVGTQTLIDNLPETTRRILFASTGDVYAPSETPHRESDQLGSMNVYGLSKSFCESLMALAGKRNPATKFLALRFFNAYGPGETNPHVLPDIFEGIRRGGTLMLGTRSTMRDYVYVTDLAAGIALATQYKGSAPVLNLGTGAAYSVDDLLELLSEILGKELPVGVNPERVRPIERQSLVADRTAATRELGWTPSHTIRDGLSKTAQWEMSERKSAQHR